MLDCHANLFARLRSYCCWQSTYRNYNQIFLVWNTAHRIRPKIYSKRRRHLSSIWHRWTAPSDGPVAFTTGGSSFDTTATRVDTGLVVSSAGDLAATWGGGVGSPAWIRIWRRPSAEDAPGQGWTLAVDFAVAAVPPAEPAR